MNKSKIHALALIFALCVMPSLCQAQAMAKLTAKTLILGNSVCSGTAIGRHALLTAEHCLDKGALTIDGQPAKILEVVKGGKDQVILRVDLTFRHAAPFGPKPLQGQRIHYIGNAGTPKLYRTGHVSAITEQTVILDVNGFMGDSGAAVFNEAGQIVGLVSGILVIDIFKMTACWHLGFTPAQIAEARAW